MYTDIPYNQREGITLGNYGDICIQCSKEGKDVKRGDLEYKEVFRINNKGIYTSLCMDHFKKMLGRYVLIDPNDLENETEDEPIVQPIVEECIEQNTKQSDEEIEKSSTKKKKTIAKK